MRENVALGGVAAWKAHTLSSVPLDFVSSFGCASHRRLRERHLRRHRAPLVGSTHADTLTGDSSANRLEGRNGNDTLAGAAGNDALLAGFGNDSLTGAVGADFLADAPQRFGLLPQRMG